MKCVQRLSLLFLAAGAVAGLGCSKSSGARVSGTVTYKGTPLTAGVVTFYGPDNQVATCSIEPDGHYALSNVPVGSATITVTVPPVAPKPKGYTVPPGGEASEKAVHIPHNYAEVDKSGLSYTVQPGSQEHIIELR